MKVFAVVARLGGAIVTATAGMGAIAFLSGPAMAVTQMMAQ